MVSLDLRTMLPVIRKAFDAGELQMQKNHMACIYAGPCAIGVCLDPETRTMLDDAENTAISDLLLAGTVTAPANQHEDLHILQFTHDNVTVEDFGEVLARLEKKYGQP